MYAIRSYYALDGILLPEVAGLLEQLKSSLSPYLLTSDTTGCGAAVAEELGIPIFKVGSSGGSDKLDFLNTIGAEHTVAISYNFV